MRFLSLFLCSSIALSPICAQSNSSVAAGSALDGPLHIHLVDGPGPARPQTKSSKGFVFQITDSTGSPVTGAAVALRLPDDGPNGSFASGLRAWVAYSDAAGIARFPVIEWGAQSGQAQLKISAAKGSTHAALMIEQQLGDDKTSVSVLVPAQEPPASVAPTATTQTAAAEFAVPKPALPQTPPQVETRKPGSVFQPLADTAPADAPAMNVAHTGVSADSVTTKPHTLMPNPPPPSKESNSEPTVTITNSPTGAGGSESHKKMWLLVGLGAGAGAAALLAVLAAHSGGAGAAGSGSNSGVTIGAPTVTVSH